MAENKKSFVLYTDLIHTIDKLPNDKAGELFKHILEYVNDTNPVANDFIIDIAFEPIKQQLIRDASKYDLVKEKRSEAGKKGMKNRWDNPEKPLEANSNFLVNDSVNPQSKVKEKKEKDPKELIFPFDSENFKTVWENLSKTKKWKNKSALALQMALKKISMHSEADAIKMMENAIAGEWQGIFDLKPGEKSSEKQSGIKKVTDAYERGINKIDKMYGSDT